MKDQSKQFLNQYIENCCRGQAEYDFYTAFKGFTSFEIARVEDIEPAIDDFFDALNVCKNAFLKDDAKQPLKLMRYSRNSVQRLFRMPFSYQQRAFADLVTEIAPRKQHTSLLEVGAGIYPKTAIYMAQKIDGVHAMDKNMLLSKESMKAMNVVAYDDFFDVNTQISQYDIVVGRQPCFAIESIVQNCVKNNKPYFIELCDCALVKGENGKRNMADWQDILKQYDVNMCWGGDRFVYNLDFNSSQMSRMIKKATNFPSYMEKRENRKGTACQVATADLLPFEII